jgi:uncharacterized membrane protein
MDSKRITLNFLLAPMNISAFAAGKVETKLRDPVHIVLYNIINTIIVSGFIYYLFSQFYEQKVGLLMTGIYLFTLISVGFTIGSVDQVFGRVKTDMDNELKS